MLATFKAQGISTVIVMIDETNLENVYIQNPFDTNDYILADSTDLSYTKNLTLHEHKLLQEEKKEMSNSDREKLGIFTVDYARWKLYARIHSDMKLNKRKGNQAQIPIPPHVREKLETVQFSNCDTEMKTVDKLPISSITPEERVLPNSENNIQRSTETSSAFTTLEFDDE